ncbi:MAG TPA: response regulator [Drouetiella sp.]
MSNQNICVLLAEDSPTDAALAKAAFAGTIMQVDLQIVKDGVEAMEYINNEKQYAQAQRPDLIILDLNMPRKNGLQTLRELKSNENFKQIPVVILTTSSDEGDISEAYDQFASCYIVKPFDYSEFEKTAKSIQDFYFSVATTPAKK